ncbi:exonuclease subunit SbcC [Staphylococcus hyicus]|uniref:exonuclease subunit SbcC n=1 Tax=Staphylococcus hyicus TaxID=1284 RepID=UPI002738646C|nr:exonuclease subunit SbcC [Staphylococcus hyicus]MDP4447826.1 exonuclease subunit SbcC [Staphylococcus hyicus]
MKPIRLKLENFGPFLNEEIDFTQIETNQLFLISGKTGSGKTMIFDAIVYALYGRASTSSREVAQLRSHFASPDVPLKVTYEFDVQHQRFKVIRSATFTKPNKKSETQGILEVYKREDTQYVLQESKINPGNAYLQSLMNLKVDQFRQLFILPQGEFKSFLVSKSQDKQTILRTLFNTVMYEDLKNNLKDKTKSIQEDMDKTYDRLSTYWQDMYALDNDNLKRHLETKVSQYTQIETCLSDFEEIGQHEIMRLSSEKTSIKTRLAQIKAKVDQENMRQQLSSDLKDIDQTLTSLYEQSGEITQLEQKLHILKESQLAIHALNELEQLEKEIENNQAKLDTLDENLKAQQTRLQHYQQKKGELDQQQTDIDTKIELLKSTHHYIQNAQDIIEAFENESSLLQRNEQLYKEVETYKTQLKELETGLQASATDFSHLEHLKEIQFRLRSQLDKIEVIEQDYRRKCQLTQQQGELKASLTSLEQKIEQLSSQRHGITEKDQSMVSHDHMIDTLRSMLSLDDPCPVCGQIVRDTHAGVNVQLLKKQLEENKRFDTRIHQLEKKCIEQQATLKHIDAQLLELESIDNPECQKQKVLKQKSDNETQIVQLTKQQQQVNTLKEQQQHVEKHIQQLQIEIDKNNYVREHAVQKVTQFKKITRFDNFSTFKASYVKLEKDVNAFQKERNRVQTNIQSLNEQILIIENDLKHQKAKYQMNQERYQHVDATVKTEMKKLKLESFNQLRDLTSEAKHIENYERRVSSYHNEVQKWTAQKETLTHQLEALPVDDINELQVQYDDIQEHVNNITQRYNETAFQVQENKKRIRKIEALIRYIQQILKEHRAIFNLSEVISGKNNLKLTLENYVLIYYLEHILDAANKRFRHMTGQRYELVRKTEKGRGYSGLEIEVFDYYSNQTRHITSLSGGETFQASLALALGLSEIVQNEQGGISLDAMFIDEGFGTLDQETLETALDTLIQLQSTGRLVGIISHVTELKNRIPIILEVKAKNYQSFTTLTFNE